MMDELKSDDMQNGDYVLVEDSQYRVRIAGSNQTRKLAATAWNYNFCLEGNVNWLQ